MLIMVLLCLLWCYYGSIMLFMAVLCLLWCIVDDGLHHNIIIDIMDGVLRILHQHVIIDMSTHMNLD